MLVLAGTGASVVLVLLFNLMSDLTGGVQVTVDRGRSRVAARTADAGSPASTTAATRFAACPLLRGYSSVG